MAVKRACKVHVFKMKPPPGFGCGSLGPAGDDIVSGPRLVQLFAQRVDVEAEGIGKGVGLAVPGVLDQLFRADHPPGVCQQVFQQRVLLAGQFHRRLAAPDSPRRRVHPQRPQAQLGIGGGEAPAQQPTDAGSNSLNSKGLVR